jgi:hypothetical protein
MMLSIALALLLAFGAFTAILYSLRKAPEGYEDNDGVHVIRDRLGVVGSKTIKSKRVTPRASRPHPVAAG